MPQRVLVVLRGPVDREVLARRCALDRLDRLDRNEPYEMALCLVLPPGHDGVHDSIQAQRELTAMLRLAMGTRAESVAVLVASDLEGFDAEACARDWGATIVST